MERLFTLPGFLFPEAAREGSLGPIFPQVAEPKSVAIFRPHLQWNGRHKRPKTWPFSGPKIRDQRNALFFPEVARRGNRAPQTTVCDSNLFVEPLRQVPQVPSSCQCIPSELWKWFSAFSAPHLSMVACMSLAFNVIAAVFSHSPTRPLQNGVLAQTIMNDTPRHTGSVHVMSAVCCMHLAH